MSTHTRQANERVKKCAARFNYYNFAMFEAFFFVYLWWFMSETVMAICCYFVANAVMHSEWLSSKGGHPTGCVFANYETSKWITKWNRRVEWSIAKMKCFLIKRLLFDWSPVCSIACMSSCTKYCTNDGDVLVTIFVSFITVFMARCKRSINRFRSGHKQLMWLR